MTLEALAAHQQDILWWEISSLMHDIGKLSDDFLYYRQSWHAMTDGWEKRDPHDNGWFIQKTAGDLPRFDNILFDDFGELAKFFGEKGIVRAVNEHTKPKPGDALMKLLNIGDSVDSQYDRNNPLAANEQTRHGETTQKHEMFRSDVFGFEGPERRICWGALKENLPNPLEQPEFKEPGILDKARRELYGNLKDLFSKYFNEPSQAHLSIQDYRAVRQLLRKYFEPALSDTTRPCNDTSLWEHVYSVASITKALLATQRMRDNFNPEKTDIELFRIWGFGFDSLRFLSSAHKIGDVLGRRQILEDIFDAAEDLVEYKCVLGNRIYRDDNCLFFLVPDLDDLLNDMQNKVLIIARESSMGEIVPHFERTAKADRNLTKIAKCIQNLTLSLNIPIRQNADFIQPIDPELRASICPVCRLRPVTQKHSTLCNACIGRRRRSAAKATAAGETPFLNEIAAGDDNSRVAMIVAKFGLNEWLNGKMIRTTLITEPAGCDRMRSVFPKFVAKYFTDHTSELQTQGWLSDTNPYDYATMFSEFKNCYAEGSAEWSRSGFLYGRAFPRSQEGLINVWNITRKELGQNLESERTEAEWKDLFNAVCAKTATPSTVLDVWETTREFLQNVAEESESYSTKQGTPTLFSKLPPLLSGLNSLAERSRVIVSVEGDCGGLTDFASFDEASIDGQPVEVVFRRDNRFAVLGRPYPPTWAGKALSLGTDPRPLRILGQAANDEPYKPYRVISSSPNLLLLLVPASSAVEVTGALYKGYLERFGKVYGRLPFSIGNIFFPQHLPMFSVLDAARRMERNFDLLGRRPRLQCEFIKPPGINIALGDGTPDHYHPYVVTASHHTRERSYFDTTAGPMVSMGANPNDALLYPNYYDFEWLGSSADRLRIHVNSISDDRPVARGDLRALVKRPRDGADGPILLDEFRDYVVELWRKLKESKVSDSHIRNFETLMQDRKKAWQDYDTRGEARLELAGALLRQYVKKELWEHVRKAYEDGFLSVTLTLYLHILKEKLGESNDKHRAAGAA